MVRRAYKGCRKGLMIGLTTFVFAVAFSAPSSAQTVTVPGVGTLSLHANSDTDPEVVPEVPNNSENPNTPENPGDLGAPETPGSGETETPTEPAKPFLQMNPMAPTNNPNLVWSWAFVQPEGAEPVAVSGYGYSLFLNGELLVQGELAADVTSFTHLATQDGVYALNIWVLPATPESEIEYSQTASVLYDATGPVIRNEGIIRTGAVATPQLTTDETGVTYSWIVAGPAGGATISDPLALAPQFRFLGDGTYVFTLTATDALGNVTTISYTVAYMVPFVPGPTTPLIPKDITPAPVDTYVRPQEVRTVVQRTDRMPSRDALAVAPAAQAPAKEGEVLAEIAQTTPADDEGQVESAAVIAQSTQGWKIVGLAWYWWILLAAIVASAWLWVVRVIRIRRMNNA